MHIPLNCQRREVNLLHAHQKLTSILDILTGMEKDDYEENERV